MPAHDSPRGASGRTWHVGRGAPLSQRYEVVSGMADGDRRPQSRIALAASVAIAIALAGVGTIGWRWYSYVTAGASPYDEVGIEVNRLLPEPLRAWGCARIKERFPRAVPPYGCQLGQV